MKMKRFLFAAIAVALVAINPVASADPGWNGSHGGGSNHGGSGGPGYHPPSAPPPQGKNNAGRRPHYGNGSNYKGGYHTAYPYPQGKNNAGRRPHYGNGSGNYQAGYPYHGGYPYRGGYPYKGWYGHSGYYRGPYYPYRPYAYPAYPAYYGYPYYGHHHNNNNNSDWPAYLIGGAVLGSVLTNIYHDSQVQQPAPINQVYSPPQGRHLLRDLNGNCYERSVDSAGNEMRTELPASACNW
jgi:hypothetical protein